MEPREVKDALYEQFARLGKAAGSPKRLEILDLLRQGQRSVEVIAEATGLGLSTASAHLQLLRQSRLVATRKEGTRVYYRIADESVSRFLTALQELARARLTEVEQTARAYFTARDALDPIDRNELQRRIEGGDVVVLDVRPPEEFAAGHISGAVSIPLEELAERIGQLPADVEVVAYCRGPYCVLAPQAIDLLHASGRRARRLADGFPEWQLAGLPVAQGA
ncbi:MAG: metalloregulator ArsR/SmtB family transcription factor [Chloroflexi bacterium]|nr:metalloregulator ArsR/SmtB family transcription factor [Chloroflexota bacterium]